MTTKNIIYFTPEFLEVLKENTNMSIETWHKVMNPFCGECLLTKGQNLINSHETS